MNERLPGKSVSWFLFILIFTAVTRVGVFEISGKVLTSITNGSKLSTASKMYQVRWRF